MTKIGIYQIALEGHVGITAEERNTVQPLSVDIEMTGQIHTASDNLDATIDYDAIARKVLEIGQASHVQLIETLAHRMAQAALEEARVESVCVRVKKCKPPLKEICGGFVVEITRQKER